MRRFRFGIRLKLFLAFLALIVLTLLAANLYLTPKLDQLWIDGIRTDLFVRVDMLRGEIERMRIDLDDRPSWDALADALAAEAAARVTVIRRDGVVLGDSELPVTALGAGHESRPEVVEAYRSGQGHDVRLSETVKHRMLYVAAPLERDGAAVGTLRLAVPLIQVDEAIGAMRRWVALGSLIALGMSLALSIFVSHKATARVRNLTSVAKAMAEGDLSARTHTTPGDELAQLGRMLDLLGQNLQRLDSLRREFASNVSHELRTPIAGLLAAAETLESGAVKDPVAAPRFVAIVRREAERLGSIVEDVISLSRIESGAVALVKERILLGPFYQKILAPYRARAAERGIQLQIVLGPKIEAVSADPRALTRALENLVDNAVKYASPGTVRLAAAPDDGMVRLTVEDDGPGIDEKHLDRLFERFYRVDTGRSRDLGGTGLGLSIVKHLVEEMGSRITVSSAPGQGSVFAFRLPPA